MKLGRFKKVMLSFAAAALVSVYGAAEAQAGWGSFGGGSHGSWGGSLGQGSTGGSWGGSRGHFHRGSHGGPIRNLVSRIRSHHSHGGSWGGSRGFASRGYGSGGGLASRGYASRGYSSFGSHGGSRGYSYYSSSRGGSTGWGSTGYTSVRGNSTGYSRPYYNSTTPYYPAVEYGNGIVIPPEGAGQPTEAAPIDNDSTPPPGPEGTNTGASSDDNTALLNLRVPAESVVYVNGRRTSTPGDFRSYVSRNLIPGQNYSYEVRAELNRDGKTLARTKVVQLTAGNNKTVDFDFHEQAETITSVTLFVPEDAKVELGGVETDLKGAVRYFSTTSLKEGEQWESYHVSVTINRDGKPVTRERVISVNAGDSAKLRFDFDTDEQIATR